MSSFDKLKTSTLPEPPKPAITSVRGDGPVERGRTDAATGNGADETIQSEGQAWVSGAFCEGASLEEDRAGEKITQAYFLELLLVRLRAVSG